jgi:prevent-host-death family protein
MDDIISIHAAKTHLSQLIARVEAGEVITIARGKTPVAKLVPIVRKGKREFGTMRGKFSIGPEFFEPLPNAELDPWEQ